MMDLGGLKWGMVVMVLFTAIVGLWTAFAVEKERFCGLKVSVLRRLQVINLATLFSGGVIVAAALVHLLPDAMLVLDRKDGDFPVGGLMAALGVLSMVLLDSWAEDLVRGSSGEGNEGYGALQGVKEGEEESGGGVVGVGGDGGGVGGSFGSDELVEMDLSGLGRVESVVEGEDEAGMALVHLSSPSGGGWKAWVSAGVLFLALTVHSAVAGLALGVTSTLEGVLDLFVAILCHKLLAAFALGRSVVRASNSASIPVLVSRGMLVAFSLSTPTGIAVGTLLSDSINPESPAVGAILALAAGMFLHVGAIEMIGHEMKHDKRHAPFVTRAAAVSIGFAAMSVLAIWT